jgi:DNA-binding NarL/FixJ family response regulator
MTPAMSRLRIFIVDDHAVVREGLKRLIEHQSSLEFVGEAADGREASELIVDARPDVAIVDVSMPGLDGGQTTRLLKKLYPHLKVIALSVHEDRAYLRELFEAGASGYVVKRAAADELIHAIRTVAGNGVYVDPRLAGSLVSSFVHGKGNPSTAPLKLTEREAKVLRRVAEGYSTKEIASELSLSIKTVETYKSRAMEKLGLRHRVDIVRYAAGCGWLTGG